MGWHWQVHACGGGVPLVGGAGVGGTGGLILTGGDGTDGMVVGWH